MPDRVVKSAFLPGERSSATEKKVNPLIPKYQQCLLERRRVTATAKCRYIRSGRVNNSTSKQVNLGYAESLYRHALPG